jgi:thymidylate synthase (FAD)
MFDPLNDSKSQMQLIDHMGSDLSVVNDARVSYDGHSDSLSDKDIKLINYLIKHKHYSVLRGVVFKFKIKAPLFIARQIWKHCLASNHNDEQIQWNEVSRRYTEVIDSGDYYVPTTFLTQSTSNKQGSGEEIVPSKRLDAVLEYKEACDDSFQTYLSLIDKGVSREQARAVLNPAFYTSWCWTVSLQSALNFIQLRQGTGAQSEIQLYANAMEELISPVVPHTLDAWRKNS